MRYVSILGLLLAAAGQVSAEEIKQLRPVADETVLSSQGGAVDWTGVYVGLSYGFGTFSDDGGVTDSGTDLTGIQVGYLHDLGTFVLGGELAYAKGDYDDFPTDEWDSTRFKLIGGYDAGAVLPYGFVGL